MKLFHYCCSHSAKSIRRDRVLKPHPQIVLDGRPMVWLTDLEVAGRDALGLTSVTLRCDRMQFVATVEDDAPQRWTTFARLLRREQREALEAYEGALPMHWWVSESPVPILSIRGTS